MMKLPLKPRDLELLNSYLDDQLNPRQRDRFESRLENEPGLVTALSELQKTRAVIRAAPRLRAPHNFTLTPEMVGHRAINVGSLYPVFRFASAIAGFLFVLVAVGDFLGVLDINGRISMDQAAPQIVAVQEMELTPQFEAAEATSSETSTMESPEYESYLAEEELAAGADYKIEGDANEITAKSGVEGISEEVLLSEDDDSVSSREMAPEEEPLPEVQELSVLHDTPVSVEVLQGVNDQPLDSELESTLGTTQNINPTSEMEIIDDWGEDSDPETGLQIDEYGNRDYESRMKVSIIRLLEGSLGSLAIITGALAWYFRRQR